VSTTVIVLIVVVVILAVVLGVVLMRRSKSTRLQEHFGPEYERRVSEVGDRRTAEAELTERRRRREELDIRELRPDERDRYQQEWAEIQRGFVDEPTRSLRAADDLVVEVMRARGYPVDDFDRRAEDISVDHPDVVHHYREARAVRDASVNSTDNGTDNGAEEADTESQRRAVTSYRSLVDALLGDGGRGTRAERHSEERTR
jgi:hypothetical protein